MKPRHCLHTFVPKYKGKAAARDAIKHVSLGRILRRNAEILDQWWKFDLIPEMTVNNCFVPIEWVEDSVAT